jgi:HAD superfamily hydrolase (TIGR01509 family)
LASRGATRKPARSGSKTGSKLYAKGTVWRPGARELLAAVRSAGLRSALVTATRRRLVEVALGTIGRSWFDVLVTGDEIINPKPDPEPYLTAARLLGVDPSRCVAVEDSPAGVRSALAAGCTVIGVPCDVALPEDLGATILPSLEGVNLEVLRSLSG